MQRLRVKRSNDSRSTRLLSAVLSRMPGAWFSPSDQELIALYRMRYKMALDEEKYDTALIFLNKILEVDPINVEAKLRKGDVYYRNLRDFSRAVEQYNKVIRLTESNRDKTINSEARTALTEIMELLS